MPFRELIERAYQWYGPALSLETAFPAVRRRAWEQTLSIMLALSFIALILVWVMGKAGVATGSTSALFIASHGHRLYGVFLIILAARVSLGALEAMRRSYYLRGLVHVLPDATYPEGGVSYAVADVLRETPEADPTGGFIGSYYGQEVLARAGVNSERFRTFASTRRPTLQAHSFMIERDGGVTLAAYAKSIFRQDQEFANFLLQSEITKEELAGAAQWVERIDQSHRAKERWWSRDELGRVEGLGKDWAYGETFVLEKYGHNMIDDPLFAIGQTTQREEDDEVEAMESALVKTKGANVLLIGKDILQATIAVARLAAKIRSGRVLPQIEHKHIFRIDPNAVIAAHREKPDIEMEFRNVFDQAVRAGNIIIVLENMPAIIASCQHVGVDFTETLRPYLTSPSVQIIATAEEGAAHGQLEQSTQMHQFFEVVRMAEVSDEGVLSILEQTAVLEERKHGVLVTYPALRVIVQNAERYFPDGVMPDKAIDLLEEVVPYAREHDMPSVTEAIVNELVEAKTGVPLGAAGAAERQNLIALEKTLHQRVIGQDAAVVAIAKAIRRSRAGIASSDRPMGSFLFLGPTGVGKTETAKALAEALFADATLMHRIDMSEFSGPDALERMIGSAGGEPGILSSMLREKQYGVLLLDEFEKSSGKVHDLFLQVLDEGQFSDARGNVVNARNLIIIATSNAAADLIFTFAQQGEDLAAKDEVIINTIIERGIYRPELLNRFDGVIVFHPLSPVHLTAIAQLKLEALAKRLMEKGITLQVTSELVAAAAAQGFDPKFGARPMNRFIQDRIEQAVADKILSGTVAAGTTVTLSPSDIGL
jgi:ATP-dependent Clp protease ATP-binding subunit ClpC